MNNKLEGQKMDQSNCLLKINENLEVKLLLLSVYDEIEEEIKRLDTQAYAHSELLVDINIIIKARNLFFVIGHKDRFKDLNSEIYGYHESDILPEYRKISIYQEQSENSSVPNGRHSLHPKEHYVKIEDYTCHIPILKIYEKSKDDHSRKEIQKNIYQNVLNTSRDYLWYLMEEYFDYIANENVIKD